jgi:hypothetical protein
MRWSDLPINPSHRTLRQFAGLWILVFGGWTVWYWLNGGAAWQVALLAAVVVTVGTIGLVAPPAIRAIFVGWMVLVFPIGWVVSRVLLLGLFVLVMTPVGLVLRLFGRDALNLRRRTGVQSYWKRMSTPSAPGAYFRQY